MRRLKLCHGLEKGKVQELGGMITDHWVNFPNQMKISFMCVCVGGGGGGGFLFKLL